MDKVRKLFKSKRTSSESRHISSVSFDTNEDKINENIPVDTNNVNDEYSDKRKEEHGKCLICNRYNTSKEWCQSCSPQLLTKGWTSGDETIDELIKATQLKATSYNNYHYLQWIPYDKLKDIEKISESGFTTVYKATWKDGSKHIDNKDHKIIEDRVIALKRSHRSHGIFDEFLNEFKNYIKLSEGFSTIHIYGLTQDPTTKEYIFVMEYMKKGNLHNCIMKEFRNLKWQDKVMILYQINNGLQQIHGEKIIHRNLHSGNILEYNNYSLCIADLRFSIPVEQASTLNKGNVFGVLPYVAPEVLCGKPYTMASDIYSLGVLMSLISTGQEPFYDIAHDEDLAFRICEGLRPAFSTNTPKFYIELAYKCMDAKPENRPTVKDIAKIIYSWYDPVIKREFKEMDKIEFDPSIVTAFIHPDASYTSRLLAFSNLPEPLNSTKVTIVESNNETFQIDLKS